jgi:hypothetical protein
MVRRLCKPRRCGTVVALFEERVLLRLQPDLYRGSDGVAAYFNGLPRWRSPSVRFSEVAAAQVVPDVINMAALASFDLDEEAAPLSVKLTWVILREDGD